MTAVINLITNLGDLHTFQTLGDREDLRRTFHGAFEQHQKTLTALNEQGAGVFFTVNETDGKGRKAENVTRIRAVFVDLDDADVNRKFDYPLAPSHIVESSPGKHHVYWVLADNMPLEQFKSVQQKLANLLGGDLKCCDLPRVLRVPGFLHLKSTPFTVREIGGNGRRYEASEILDWIGKVDLPVPANPSDSATAFTEGSRNNDLFLYCRRLRIQGCNDIEVEILGFAKASECSPPLSKIEARTVIASSKNYTAIDSAEIARLAALPKIDYDRIRAASAKAQGVRTSTLDALVNEARKVEEAEEGDELFPEVTPWDDPVDLADLLDEISHTVRRFIAIDHHLADLAALWVTASWFVDCVHVAPIALINAPAKACGKTQMLTVLQRLAPRGVQCAGISPSVLFRMIEGHAPTLFVDEIETVLRENEELRGLFNAGHTRDSAFVWRNVPVDDGFDPMRFNVFGFKALAGINAINLADTVTSRSIVFEMRRKKKSENVERLRDAEPGLFAELRSKLARCATDYADAVKHAKPELPDTLGDREQDNLEPLMQIAEVAGGLWPLAATAAASRMFGEREGDDIADELLSDVREIFETKHVDRISSPDLLYSLTADEDKSWQTYNRGKPLTPRQLSRKLAAYGIKAKNIRVGAKVTKGFELIQFFEVFERYLAPSLSEKQHLPATKSLKPAPILDLACSGSVAGKNRSRYKEIKKPRNVLTMRVPSVAGKGRAFGYKKSNCRYMPLHKKCSGL